MSLEIRASLPISPEFHGFAPSAPATTPGGLVLHLNSWPNLLFHWLLIWSIFASNWASSFWKSGRLLRSDRGRRRRSGWRAFSDRLWRGHLRRLRPACGEHSRCRRLCRFRAWCWGRWCCASPVPSGLLTVLVSAMFVLVPGCRISGVPAGSRSLPRGPRRIK